jgi:hypothetical protein
MECVPFCGSEAIAEKDGICSIEEKNCVECYVCLKSGICAVNAFEEIPSAWPRSLRHAFSSVGGAHKQTGISGRGTAEMKTNDITGRYRLGEVGFTVDVGRPGLGTTFHEVEKISMAVAKIGVEFEPLNPTTKLMVESRTGRFRDDIKTERVLSCIIEFKTEEAKLIPVINILRDVAKTINTVFSVGCISRCKPDGTIPIKAALDKAEIFYRPNGKVNIGLGLPKAP